MGSKIASIIGILALMVASSILTWYVIKTKPSIAGIQTNNSGEQQAVADGIISKVGRLMMLPSDETPTVASVTDATKVNTQPFFASAQNGDDILIYQKAQKIILYRPSTNIIINVGSITYNQTPAATPSATPSSKPGK